MSKYISRDSLRSFIEQYTESYVTSEELDAFISRTFKDMELCQEFPILDLVMQIYESENRDVLRKMALTLRPSETLAAHELITFQFYK